MRNLLDVISAVIVSATVWILFLDPRIADGDPLAFVVAVGFGWYIGGITTSFRARH